MFSSQQREALVEAVIERHGCPRPVAELWSDLAIAEVTALRTPVTLSAQVAGPTVPDSAESAAALFAAVTDRPDDVAPSRYADPVEVTLAEPWQPPPATFALLAPDVTPERNGVKQCLCGCPRPVTPPREYASNACRQRAYRARRHAA